MCEHPPVQSLALKRVMDVVASGFLLLIAALPMFCIACAVRVRMGRPVLFRHERPGLCEQPFTLLKFRTMTVADHDASDLDVQRLTRLGAFLRATSLDELPTLLNVLRGDMSLVGPRPLLFRYLARYTPEERRRHDVRPGITGLAQTRGRNALDWDASLALDVQYVDSWTNGGDVLILLHTLASVLRREGISAPGHVTRAELRPEADR